jgi:hydrogenase maturation protein HypF
VSPPARLRLFCRGVVQGVGFRPLVHRLAAARGLAGVIENVAGAVRLELQGPRPALEALLGELPGALPAPARLQPLQPTWLPPLDPAPHGLRIAAAAPQPLGVGLVAPALVADLAPCPACLAELHDPASRRHHYPFISCAACGPRYSIATAAPYARAHTTLAAFPLCPACLAEFHDPANRRFHAETIGCPACGPRLSFWGPDGLALPGDSLEGAAELLRGGGILALQGVGGFQLLVDAAAAEAVARLRRRKGRPAKPFALLVADATQLAPWVELSPEAERLLASPAAPIVLLPRRPGAWQALPEVAPGSAALGVMLSASPLHQLLALALQRPLVATSGNRSGELLCTHPAEALERLAGIADGFLVHNRPIARPLDDSLVQLVEGQPALLRRARGYAPTALALPAAPAIGRTLFALGGDLKSAPALLHAGRCWPAPHLGDLAGARQQCWLEQGLAELSARYGAQLEAISCDAHPCYVSQASAVRLASERGLPLRRVQHHRAHGLAVAAEHGLPLPLLAWCCDGLGLAPDALGHQLWGGELLLLEPGECRHLAGLRPFPLPGGEAAMRQGWRVALGLLVAMGDRAGAQAPAACRSAAAAVGGAQSWELLAAATAAGVQAPLCSSLGRLFDGAAALLAVCQQQSYEGEAGLRLEGLARQGFQPQELAAGGAASGPAGDGPLVPVADPEGGWLDWQPLIEQLLTDRAAGLPPARSALALHSSLAEGLAELAARAAREHGCQRVALAGGCFQNALLLELTAAALRRRGLEPFWPGQLPCNDGGLALGQLWAALGELPITKESPP